MYNDSGCAHLSDHFDINNDHNLAPSDFNHYQQAWNLRTTGPA